MVRRRPSVSSTSSPSLPVKRNSGQPERDTFNLDGFVSSVYLPHIRLRKRSWRVDERIARQHLSPTFGARELADIQRHEVEDWLCRLSVLQRTGPGYLQPHSGGLQGNLFSGRNTRRPTRRAISVHGRLFL